MRLSIVLIVILGAGIGWLWWSQQRSMASPAWQGYAEADYVKAAPVEQGMLIKISVSRGDQISKGDPLFTQDDTHERAARDQAARQLAQAEEQLGNLEAASKPTEVAQAEANLTDARSTLERARADLQRDEALLRTGYSTAQTVDQRRADYRSAEVLAQPGETMAAGAPVVSILPPENIFVRFFVPETALSGLHRGDPVSLSCDGCRPGLTGTVSFISPTAEYTPPVIYSESTRAKLVYRIEARPRADQAALFNPGQPIDVRPIRTGAKQ